MLCHTRLESDSQQYCLSQNAPAADWRLLPMSRDCMGLAPSVNTSEVRPLRDAEKAEVIVPYMLPAVMPAGRRLTRGRSGQAAGTTGRQQVSSCWAWGTQEGSKFVCKCAILSALYACAAWKQGGLGNTAGLVLALRSTAKVQKLVHIHAARLRCTDRLSVTRSVAPMCTAA